jgi:hypothetical protein
MTARILPEQFEDLAPHLSWALPTEYEPRAMRANRPMADIRIFYDAMLKRMDEVKRMTASGTGKVHSWTVAHHPYHPAFVTEVPYTLVLVELSEGPRAMGRFDGEALAIRDEVHGAFIQREGSTDLVFSRTFD